MPLTAEQVAERTKYIGSTDAAAVLGLSRWKTPLEVWAEKTGAVPAKDLSDVLAIEVGTELEDLVCKLFTKRTGKEVRRVKETIYHPAHKFLAANVDRRVVGEDSILEAKTCSAWRAKEWEGEDVPQEYIIQCMHQLAVTGREQCYIAVLIGGNQDFRWKVVRRDESIIKEMVGKMSAFWELVESKTMPSTITRHDAGVLQELFPVGSEEEPVSLGPDADKILDSLQALKSDLRTLEGVIEKEENELKAMLKDKAAGMTDRYRVTWRNQVTQRLDTKRLKAERPELAAQFMNSTETRVFRVKEIAHNREE